MSKAVVVIIQRGLLGTIAEHSVMLDDGENRWPITTEYTWPDAYAQAQAAKREHLAGRIRFEDEGKTS